jgi:hypothetical protein
MAMLEQKLVGRRITAVRPMNAEERTTLGVNRRDGVAVVLDDGTALIPMADWEGNDSGALFQHRGKGVFTDVVEESQRRA